MTAYAYDADNNLLTVTDPNGNVTTYAYDALNRKISETDADPDGSGSLTSPVTAYTYDADNNLLTVTDPRGYVTAYAYDALNRQISETDADPDGSGTETSPVTSYGYDADNNLLTVTDPLGHVTAYAYDNLNRKISETDADPDGGGSLTSPVTLYTYDAAGNLLTLTDPDANTTLYTYDALNREVSETNQHGDSQTMVYDEAGNVVQTIDRNGQVINYTYDHLNRKTQEQWLDASSTVTNTITSVYDAEGRLTSVSDSSSTTTYTYDNLNRVTAEDVTHPALPTGEHVVTHSVYDADGNRTLTYVTVNGVYDAFTLYTYDNLNRVVTEQQFSMADGLSAGLISGFSGSASSVTPKRVLYKYDAAGNMKSLYQHADLANADPVSYTSYIYDGLNRVTSSSSIIFSSPSGFTRLYQYTYDAASRLTEEYSPDGISDYTYDNDNQLLTDSLTGEDYSYDTNGNRTANGANTVTPDTDNQITSDGLYTYIYDANGNITTRINAADTETVLYTWDNRNRLTSLTYLDSLDAHNILQTITYTYDTQNRRISKTVNVGGTTTVNEQYIYDGDNLALVLDTSTGDVTQRYLMGPGQNQILAEETVSTSSTKWALTDNEGSVKDVVDNGSGHALLDHIVYDSYGNIVSQTNSANAMRMGYTGYQQDPETGLYYANARYYDPQQGRFISTDPMSFAAGTTNLYQYVGNHPTYASDPTGMYEGGNFLEGTITAPTSNYNSSYSSGYDAISTLSAPAVQSGGGMLSSLYDGMGLGGINQNPLQNTLSIPSLEASYEDDISSPLSTESAAPMLSDSFLSSVSGNNFLQSLTPYWSNNVATQFPSMPSDEFQTMVSQIGSRGSDKVGWRMFSSGTQEEDQAYAVLNYVHSELGVNPQSASETLALYDGLMQQNAQHDAYAAQSLNDIVDQENTQYLNADGGGQIGIIGSVYWNIGVPLYQTSTSIGNAALHMDTATSNAYTGEVNGTAAIITRGQENGFNAWTATRDGLANAAGDILGYKKVVEGIGHIDIDNPRILDTTESWQYGLTGSAQMMLTGSMAGPYQGVWEGTGQLVMSAAEQKALSSLTRFVTTDAAENTPQYVQNFANGQAFERQGLNYLEGVQNNVADQVSVRPYLDNGDLANYRVRLDAIAAR